MIKKQTILPDSYVSPVCKTVVLGPRAHYLQNSSPYGYFGAAGAQGDLIDNSGEVDY